MAAVTLRSYAKINVGLVIGPPGYRQDGFHELRTVYQTIGLYDRVKVEYSRRGSGITIRSNDPRVPRDATNTCWKAAERTLAALKLTGSVEVTIDKRLPLQGGMGAASSNAVATMLGLEQSARKRLDDAARFRIAEQVGSDVPLFLIGGTVLGVGRGEQVYPLPDLPTWDLVIATPAVGVSTPQAFRDWDELFEDQGPSTRARGARASLKMTQRQGAGKSPNAGAGKSPELTISGQSDKLNTFSRAVAAWLLGSTSGVPARGGDRAEALLLDLVRTGIENDFERVVFLQIPALRKVKNAMEAAGSVYASLSGSGSTVYGIFRNRATARKAAQRLSKQGIPAVATHTVNRAAFIRR